MSLPRREPVPPSGKRPRDGSEPLRARPAPLRLRAVLATYGLVACGVLAFLAWRADLTWLAVPLVALAVLALADLVWLRYKQEHRRARNTGDGASPTRATTPPDTRDHDDPRT